MTKEQLKFFAPFIAGALLLAAGLFIYATKGDEPEPAPAVSEGLG